MTQCRWKPSAQTSRLLPRDEDQEHNSYFSHPASPQQCRRTPPLSIFRQRQPLVSVGLATPAKQGCRHVLPQVAARVRGPALHVGPPCTRPIHGRPYRVGRRARLLPQRVRRLSRANNQNSLLGSRACLARRSKVTNLPAVTSTCPWRCLMRRPYRRRPIAARPSVLSSLLHCVSSTRGVWPTRRAASCRARTTKTARREHAPRQPQDVHVAALDSSASRPNKTVRRLPRKLLSDPRTVQAIQLETENLLAELQEDPECNAGAKWHGWLRRMKAKMRRGQYNHQRHRRDVLSLLRIQWDKVKDDAWGRAGHG